jgi:hypothetical protein
MRKYDGDYYQVQLEEFVTVVKKLYQFYSASINLLLQVVVWSCSQQKQVPNDITNLRASCMMILDLMEMTQMSWPIHGRATVEARFI